MRPNWERVSTTDPLYEEGVEKWWAPASSPSDDIVGLIAPDDQNDQRDAHHGWTISIVTYPTSDDAAADYPHTATGGGTRWRFLAVRDS